MAETCRMNLLNLCTTLLTLLLLFDESDAKYWKDYMLTVGPKPTESGRYVYSASIGGFVHCHYCERKALIDSTYSFLQQKLCIANYRHNESITNQVSKEEKENALYPICVKGTVPGCGRPPEDNKANVHMWQCDPGFSNKLYSVYFSCALVCNRTDQVVRSYYCNESLKWEAERYVRPSQPCELPPIPLVAKEDSPMIIIMGVTVTVGAIILVAFAVVFIACICYRRKKILRASDPHEREPDMEDGNALGNDGNALGNDVRPLLIVDDAPNVEQSANISLISRTPSNSRDSNSSQFSDQRRPLIQDDSTGTDSSSHGEDEEDGGEGAIGRSPHTNVPVYIPNPANSRDKPDIKIIYWKDNTSKHSVPMQGGHYSIEKGLDFHIIPNSTGGHVVREFKVERKGDGRPFRGKSELHFWNTINSATEWDAGLFSWKMLLDNGSIHEGSFEIYIMLPALSSLERPETLGLEMQQTPPRVNDITSIVPDLDTQSMLSDKKVKTYRQQCRAEIHQDNHNALMNASMLSSHMYNEYNYTDSVLFSENRINSSNSGNSRNNFNNSGFIPELMRCSTSGYQTNTISEIDQEQFIANYGQVSKLNLDSLMASNSLARNKFQHNLSHRSSVQYTRDPLSEIPECANHNLLRGELDENPTGMHGQSYGDQVDDLPIDESIVDQVDGMTKGTREEPIEDQLDGAALSGRPDPDGHASQAPCRDSRGTDENTLRKEIVMSEDSETNSVIPTIEQHGTVNTTVQHDTVPTTVQHGTVPTMVQQGTVPTTVQNDTVPTTVQHGTVPTTVQHGTVPTTIRHCVSDTEHNDIDEMHIDSFEMELQDYSMEEPAEKDHESRM